MMVQKKAIIIAHCEDLDGIVSAAIIKFWLLQNNYGPNQIKIELVNYNEAPEKFDEYLNQKKNDSLFIADLGINSILYEKILQSLGKEQSSIPNYYVDHHMISLRPRKY